MARSFCFSRSRMWNSVSRLRPRPCWPGGKGRLAVGQFGRPQTAAPTRRHIRCFGPIFCIRPRFQQAEPHPKGGVDRPLSQAELGGDISEGGVGTAGFEPATSATRTLRATKLRYVPPAIKPADSVQSLPVAAGLVG